MYSELESLDEVDMLHISPFMIITSKWLVRVRRYFIPTFPELLFLLTLGLGIEVVHN